MEVSIPLQTPVQLPIRPQPRCAPSLIELKLDDAETNVDAEIKDLCSRLSHKEICHCLGYICDDERTHRLPWPAQEDELRVGGFSFISLATLLQGQENSRLTRHERYNIASILASSLVQLQSTPWLAEEIEKSTIFFCRQDNKVFVGRPYIRHSFVTLKTSQTCSNAPVQPPMSPRFMARNSLINLGILLLELRFGQPIESQAIRNMCLGSDGKPHNSTNYMTALLWADMDCEEDPALEHIVKCCVFYNFEEKPDWNNKKFTQAVYNSIVEPLEMITAQ